MEGLFEDGLFWGQKDIEPENQTVFILCSNASSSGTGDTEHLTAILNTKVSILAGFQFFNVIFFTFPSYHNYTMYMYVYWLIGGTQMRNSILFTKIIYHIAG